MTTAHVGIVVVTYNRSDVTTAMLDSLYLAPNKLPFSLIIVDNASNSLEWESIEKHAQQMISKHGGRIHFIRSDNNLGFAGGNNLGIKAFCDQAHITHLCLLNNDTLLSEGWLDRLVRDLPADALISPVTNSCGNEQMVYDKLNVFLDNVPDAVNQLNELADLRAQHSIYRTQMLGFFCVLGAKATFQKIGFLDTKFGLGYFEDDDYAQRAKTAGVSLWIDRRVFVFHWGSSSFAMMSGKKLELMAKNALYFKSKHGFSPELLHVKYPAALSWAQDQVPSLDELTIQELMVAIERDSDSQSKYKMDIRGKFFVTLFNFLRMRWGLFDIRTKFHSLISK